MVDRTPAGKSFRVVLLLLVLSLSPASLPPEHDSGRPVLPAPVQEGCTIGVASARATSDGRPLLWKIRDNSDLPDNSVAYDTSYPHRFIAVTNAGDMEVWMGVNERGFAIINSTSLDLPGGISGLNNGLLMRFALGTCATVEEFGLLLESTNATGRRTQGNFGVIDTAGNAVMFEVGGNAYWRFDANKPSTAPEGYVLRTNFSMTGGGSVGVERYRRAAAQTGEFRRNNTLDYRSIIRYQARDFSDYSSHPLPIPYPREWIATTRLGYIYSNVSICRHKSISATAIIGVMPGELPSLSTMVTILGQPASGIAVPYWPVGIPPGIASGVQTPPLNVEANSIRSLLFDLPDNVDYLDSYKLRDECGNGLWSLTFPAEDSILNATSSLLEQWRGEPPSAKRMLGAENALASSALAQLTRAHAHLLCRVPFDVANDVPYKDENGQVLDNGDIVQLIWAGNDHKMSPPDMEKGSPRWGQPTGDDRLIGVPHVMGDNVSTKGMFYFQVIGWTDRGSGFPAAGDLVYLRAFNSNRLEAATRYGDARPYEVSARAGLPYTPLINDGRTTQPLGEAPANPVPSARFNLSPNFPNPFNSSTSIEYEVPYGRDARGPLDITVFNNLGQVVRTLFSGLSAGGWQRVEWDGKDNAGDLQPSGVYYIRLKAGTAATMGRMLLLK